MKYFRVWMIFFIFILFLSGCGPIYQTNYSYRPPHSNMGMMCASQCFQTKNMCEQMCQMQDQNCRLQEHQSAYYRYQLYRDSQVKKGLPVVRSVSDFDNSFGNCHATCNCTNDFNLCYQSCGGVVLEQKVCTAFCN
jgi:hypothetical protein